MQEYCSRCDNYKDPKYKFEYCKRCGGDWFCNICKTWNWPQNEACFKCFVSKKPERNLLICTQCKHQQYFDLRCKKCGFIGLEDAIFYKIKLDKLEVLKK